MDKPFSADPSRRPSTRRRARLIPATPHPEGAEPLTAQPARIPTEGTSRQPEQQGGDLYSGIIRDAMARLRNFETKAEGTSSNKDSSKSATQADPTSSSSLRFSTDDGEGIVRSQGRRRSGQTFEEIATEVMEEMSEDEEKEANRAPQEDPIREILDLTGADDEEATASDDWRKRMEETVDMLVLRNAEQCDMLRVQRKKMTEMIDIVDKLIPCIDEEPHSARQLSSAASAAEQSESPQIVPDTNLAGPSRKRKPTATTNQLEKRSGAHGNQKNN